MAKFERHVFVCGNVREPGHVRGCCSARGGDLVRDAFKSELKRRGLTGRIRANQSGCLDQCEHGPCVVVYPEQVWYGFLKPEDVPEIVDQHLVGGRPVQRLMLADTCINAARCPHRGGAGDAAPRPGGVP